MQLLDGNYIDLLIILGLSYFVLNAIKHGFWVLFADFISFFGSLILSLRVYKYLADILKVNFALGSSVANAFAFLFSAILIESVLGFILGNLVHKLPIRLRKHTFNKLLGILPALGEGVVLISFLLTLLISLPIKPQIKSDVADSKIGSYLLERTVVVEKYLDEVFGGVINDSLTYLTVKPESRESVVLDIKKVELVVDEKAEAQMFARVNEERKKLAIAELIWEPILVLVGREHAKNMWEKKYFSHFSPEGKDVGDRLADTKVRYSFAGENLALAPTVQTAHTGLMNSKGHRENILEPRFKKIGIGVIDNGVYGKMFVQVFSD